MTVIFYPYGVLTLKGYVNGIRTMSVGIVFNLKQISYLKWFFKNEREREREREREIWGKNYYCIVDSRLPKLELILLFLAISSAPFPYSVFFSL